MEYHSPTTTHDDDQVQCCCRKYFGWGRILATILLLIVIIPVAVFMIRTAVLKLPNVQVDSLSLTNFTYTQSVTGTWRINLLIHNPNHKSSLNYEKFRTVLYYKNATLSESHIAPFSQNRKSDTTLNVTISAANFNVEETYLVMMNKEITQNGLIEFNVEIVTSIKHKGGVYVECSKVRVRITSNATSGELAEPNYCKSYNS